ncbi:MAG: flavodoxin family protein, partial [Clostridiales bacterium]|nr:flavodoxin family protein [Clostridiales bacterium]
MKVLILNGSPKIERSNTLHVTDAFVSGFPEGTEVKRIDIYAKDIKPCRGCFACWASADGTCAIKDDMAEIIAAIKESDVIIESFPLYFYGMPSQLKAVTDRCLALAEPYMGTRSDDG